MARKYSIICFWFILFITLACNKDIDPVYRQRMREFVISISQYAKTVDADFLIIPQNGIELVSENGEEDGPPVSDYLQAIDANGQEDLFYGYNRDNKQTPDDESNYLINFLNISQNEGNLILVTDYCSSAENMDDSYAKNNARGYTSFAAPNRELNCIPAYPEEPYNTNDDDIESISQLKNFLYLINPENYSSKEEFILAVNLTNYDLVILDLYFTEEISFNASDINRMKVKANGGTRLVVCYMSIGEAEDYRYYWQPSWKNNEPAWLDRENPDWEGNYKVHYWDPEWQSIIYGNDASYTKKILDAGFDGAYLDIIDAYEYYE